MFYWQTVTVPKNTTADNPQESRFFLSDGVITKVIFAPRSGHASLCHCKVFHRRHQIFPSSGDQDLHGDAYPIEWPEWYVIPEKPFYLEIVAWNDDDTYSHTFDLAVSVIPRYAALPFAFAKAIGDLAGLLSPKRISIPSWLGGSKKVKNA